MTTDGERFSWIDMNERTYAVACFAPDFDCGSMVRYRVCFPFLRFRAQKWKTKKREKYRSAEGEKR